LWSSLVVELWSCGVVSLWSSLIVCGLIVGITIVE
jgi:hypothetical protein